MGALPAAMPRLAQATGLPPCATMQARADMPEPQLLTGEYRGDKYEVLKQISKGAFGTVFTAVRHQVPRQGTPPAARQGNEQPVAQQQQGEQVAIKFIPLTPSEDYLKMVKREVVIINQLTHPHVVRVRDLVKVPVFKDGNSAPTAAIGLVMDLARCSLQVYLQKYKQLPEGAIRWWFQQLMLAIDHCHSKKVVQRDIKPGNILIFPVPESKNTHILKLADFGWAKRFDISDPKTRAGTPIYAAPEVLAAGTTTGPEPQVPQQPYDPEAADVWSCGVVLFHLLYAKEFEDVSKQMNTVVGVRDWASRIPPPATSGRSPQCGDLLRKMLQVVPKQRATMKDVMEHPWFTEGLPPGAKELNNTAGHEAPLIRQDLLEQWLDSVFLQYTGLKLPSKCA